MVLLDLITRNSSSTAVLDEVPSRPFLADNIHFDHGRFGNGGHALVERADGFQITFRTSMRDPLPADVRAALMARTVPNTVNIPDKPSADMLKAMVSPELDAGDGRQALAVQVEDLLGYTPLRKDAGAPSRLQRVLQELEIEAFDPATVDAYKRKMQAHFQAKLDAEKPRRSETSVSVFGERRSEWISVDEGFGRRTEKGVAWRMVLIEDYRKPVPEHVLRKAVQIKQAAPDATFYVDELREETRTFDPFLIVQIGQDHAAIEVWDEPEFEKTL